VDKAIMRMREKERNIDHLLKNHIFTRLSFI